MCIPFCTIYIISNYLHVTSHNNDTRHWHNTTITSNHNNDNNSTTTTNGRNRDGRGGAWARDRRVSSLTGMFFFHVFFNYTNLLVPIRDHPPPINLDASESNHPRHCDPRHHQPPTPLATSPPNYHVTSPLNSTRHHDTTTPASQTGYLVITQP